MKKVWSMAVAFALMVNFVQAQQDSALPQLAVVEFSDTDSTDRVKKDFIMLQNLAESQDVSTGRFSHSANDFIGVPGICITGEGVTMLEDRFTAEMSSCEGQVVQVQMETNNYINGDGYIYNIGDYGPAGGIVFYDKGVFSNGWRYLEAAPSEAEAVGQWGAYEKMVGGTATAVGSGKQNTQRIVEFLRDQGETNRAAQLCEVLDFNGFTDWFLPSKDELDLMYKNLKATGLGEFNNPTYYRFSYYWSSSENNSVNAWMQRFSDSIQTYILKNLAGVVRAVRAF
jgi:hypothetical protein